MSATTIPKGSLVLVTGVSGYLGLHVADQLVLAGYKVRGTVRDEEKAEWTTEYFTTTYGSGHFEVAVVQDLSKDGVYEKLVKGVSGIVHVASDTSFGSDPNKVVTPVVNGITNILQAAANEPSVKSFVLTSSSVAISPARANVKFHIDHTMWNEEDVQKAWAPPPYDRTRSPAVYAASKMQGEQAAWKFIKDHQPSFVLNSVNPNFIMGTVLHKKQNKSTAGWLLGVKDNVKEVVERMQAFTPQWMVDARDCALLHVIALTNPAVKNERLLGYAETFDYNKYIGIMKKIAPEETGHLKNIENCPVDLSTVDSARSEELLKGVGLKGWTTLEESMQLLLDSDKRL